MISEVDIRDWEHIDLPLLKTCKNLLEDEGYTYHPKKLEETLNQLIELRNKQLKAIQKLPALLDKDFK